MHTHNLLTADTLSIIDLEEEVPPKLKELPRRQVPVTDLSPRAAECLRRAVLELQRRFYGIDGEDVNTDPNVRLSLSLDFE